MGVLFIDCESTGLDPRVHVPWEVAVVEPDGTEHVWCWRPVTHVLEDASAQALAIGGFHNRAPQMAATEVEHAAAADIVALTEGNVLVGSNPSFDVAMLTPWLRAWGLEPAWHHRPVCVATMAYGWLHGYDQAAGECIDLPWRSDDLSRSCGVDPDRFDRHTALGDALWVKAWFERLTGDDR